MLDEMDLKILKIMQEDATRPVADIGKEVGLSTTPCWRRIQKLEEAGIIRRRVALLDPTKVNCGVTVFVSIKTDRHSYDWLEKFHSAAFKFPEVVELYRMSGEIDYLLRVVTSDLSAYERFLIEHLTRVPGVASIKSSFALKQVAYRTALPIAGESRSVSDPWV